jgi:uroporphyrinogen-III synthase
MELVKLQKVDFRSLPKIMVCGRGTGDVLAEFGLFADAQPESDFSAESLLELARETVRPGDKILRLRSDKAGSQLAEALRQTGAEVEDAVMYDNRRVDHEVLPDFDAVFFASASAVESFIDQWKGAALAGKTICVIGSPTAKALAKYGIRPTVIAREATVRGAINSLAEHFVGEELCSPKPD